MILASGLTAHSQKGDKINPQSDQFGIKSKITFKKTKGEAILIGDTIKALDNNLKVVDRFSNFPSTIVEIIGVSDSLFNYSKDICDAFWYLKVKGEKINGVINGRQVYEIQNSDQDTCLPWNKYFGLIYLIHNEYSKEANWENEYPFFQMRDDEGRKDKIKDIIIDDKRIMLKIHREYQEGENDYDVLLKFENDRYLAEYLNFGEIKY